ncbi:Vta1 like [Novymonas esmeraldas]|uniref:Vta1 like n=1 Tax=Novymonas esmeraldas TaxID=1808958 RepID=A0AAW0EZV8_9TRYP
MASSAALLAKVPEAWVPLVRPTLQRAHEFEEREPLVAYYLRTHVGFLCMRHRKKEDKAGTAFLMTLLDALEADKGRLAAQLQGVEGRTVLTKFALMLFARADDAERTGTASMATVRTFYTAAVLFEATAQFTSDGAMDSIATQKSRYAKYIAARMKKALDAQEPYVSPNKLEAVEDGGASGGQDIAFNTVPASCFGRPTVQSSTSSDRPAAPTQTHPAAPAYVPPPSMPKLDSPPPPAYTYDAPDVRPSTYTPPQPASTKLTYAQTPTPPQQQQQQRLSTSHHGPATPSSAFTAAPAASTPQPRNVPALPPSSTSTSSSNGGGSSVFKPSVDQMIDAQKNASQAVSALQFYDYETAKRQLAAALRILNGVGQ